MASKASINQSKITLSQAGVERGGGGKRSKDNFLIVLFRYFILFALRFALCCCVYVGTVLLLIFGRMLSLLIYSIRLL